MIFETHKVIYSGAEENGDLLGKVVYFANDLLELSLNVEKENASSMAILVSIDNDTLPFKVRLQSGCETWVKLLYPLPEVKPCVVNSEEEKVTEGVDPQFRPFANVDELIERWNFLNPCTRPNYTMPLIWVRYKAVVNDAHNPTVQLITAFSDLGVEMGAEFMTWDYLFERMEFLDGTPCGVLLEY